MRVTIPELPPRVKTSLTKRELQVLDLMSRGFRNANIAPILGIGEKTVEAHRHRAFQFLDARNGAHAVRVAFERGLLKTGELPGFEMRGVVAASKEAKTVSPDPEPTLADIRPEDVK
jgi:DNA-binding CsgD family transcriptional regulator